MHTLTIESGLARVGTESVDPSLGKRVSVTIPDGHFKSAHAVLSKSIRRGFPIEGEIFSDHIVVQPKRDQKSSDVLQPGHFLVEIRENETVSIQLSLYIKAGVSEAFGVALRLLLSKAGAVEGHSRIRHSHQPAKESRDGDESIKALELKKRPTADTWSEHAVSVFPNDTEIDTAEIERVLNATLTFLVRILTYVENTAKMNKKTDKSDNPDELAYFVQSIINLPENWSDNLRLRIE